MGRTERRRIRAHAKSLGKEVPITISTTLASLCKQVFFRIGESSGDDEFEHAMKYSSVGCKNEIISHVINRTYFDAHTVLGGDNEFRHATFDVEVTSVTAQSLVSRIWIYWAEKQLPLAIKIGYNLRTSSVDTPKKEWAFAHVVKFWANHDFVEAKLQLCIQGRQFRDVHIVSSSSSSDSPWLRRDIFTFLSLVSSICRRRPQ